MRDDTSWPFLSPNDEQWTWQDSPWITALRELTMRLVAEYSERTPEPRLLVPANEEQKRTLDTLAVSRTLQRNLETQIEHLILELRATGASWGLISQSLDARRQSTHQRYRHLETQVLAVLNLTGELTAARRVALDLVSSTKTPPRDAAAAMDFLEWSERVSAEKTTSELKRLYR